MISIAQICILETVLGFSSCVDVLVAVIEKNLPEYPACKGRQHQICIYPESLPLRYSVAFVVMCPYLVCK